MIIFIALSIAANQASLNEALEKYRNLQTEINPLNDFSKLKDKIAKVDLLINCDFIKKNKESFMAFYLKKIKHDLDILNNMSDSEKSEFSLIYKDFFSYLFFGFKNDPIEKGYSNVLKMENAMTKKFGEFSYVHLIMENYKMLATLEFKKQYNFKKYFLQRYTAYKNSDWKNNPEISFFLIMLCGNCENMQNYNEMIDFATELSSAVSNNYAEDDIKQLDHQGFLLLAYTKTNNFKKAHEVFKDINKKHFLSIDRNSSKVFFRIHSSSFELFTNLGMKKEALQSQELKLEAMTFFIKDDSANIVAEAKILRDLYIEAKELEKARKLESRFKLSLMSK